MFDSLFKYFRSKFSKPEKTKKTPKLCINLSDPDDTINNEEFTSFDNYTSLLPVQHSEKENIGMTLYLVVLDTQNRPEVKDRGLQGGLKNFYLVRATTERQAQEKVLATFRNPHVISQIQYSIKATPLKKIVDTIEDGMLWSYVPFSQGTRAPGQKATPISQRVNPNDRDQVIPLREAPIVRGTQKSDVTKAEWEEAKRQGGRNPKSPNNMMNPMMMNPMMMMMNPMMMQQMGMNPEQLQQMQESMQMMMQQMGMDMTNQPGSPITVQRGDPNDPELQQRMNSVRNSAVANHRTQAGIGDAVISNSQDDFSEAEAQARAEIEAFKRLPKSQQTNTGLKYVDMNDNQDIDMDSFNTVSDRLGERTRGVSTDEFDF